MKRTDVGDSTAAESSLAPDACDLRGRCVIISGGTTGIGRATAKLLVSQGAKVFIFGRHEQQLPAALDEIRSAAANGARGGEAYGTVADQSRSEDVQRVFREADERLGGCNILINNAAVSGGSVTTRSLDEIRYVVETNLLGYMTCAHERCNGCCSEPQAAPAAGTSSTSAR